MDYVQKYNICINDNLILPLQILWKINRENSHFFSEVSKIL
jgi:hypothetical protein